MPSRPIIKPHCLPGNQAVIGGNCCLNDGFHWRQRIDLCYCATKWQVWTSKLALWMMNMVSQCSMAHLLTAAEVLSRSHRLRSLHEWSTPVLLSSKTGLNAIRWKRWSKTHCATSLWIYSSATLKCLIKFNQGQSLQGLSPTLTVLSHHFWELCFTLTQKGFLCTVWRKLKIDKGKLFQEVFTSVQNFPSFPGQKDTKTPGVLLLFKENCLKKFHLIKTYPMHSPCEWTVCAPLILKDSKETCVVYTSLHWFLSPLGTPHSCHNWTDGNKPTLSPSKA